MSSFDGSIYIDLNDEQLARNPEEHLKSFMGLNLDSIIRDAKNIENVFDVQRANPGN